MCVCVCVWERARESTFSSRALWCSKSDFRALRTSTSLETPDGGGACLFTTVILRLRSWRDTRHSRCSNSSYSTNTHTHTNVCMTKENTNSRNIVCFHQRQTHARPQRHTRTHIDTHTLVLFLSAFSSDISSSFSSSCSRHMFSSFVRVANSYTTNTHTQHPYRG